MKKQDRSSSQRLKQLALGVLAVTAGPAAVHGQVTFLNSFGITGSGNGQFSFTSGIAVNSSGTVYVADCDNNRVETFNSTGVFLSSFGTTGSGNGQFDNPQGIAINSNGTVYVADGGNDRVDVFDSAGDWQSSFGSAGNYSGRFSNPVGVAVNSSGTIFVVDNNNDRVQAFTSTGGFQSSFGSLGSGNGQLSNPQGVAVSSSGSIYVGDDSNNRVEVFNSAGAYQSSFGTAGSGNGQFNQPSGVTFGPTGDIYVADYYNNRVQIFDANGNYLSSFGSQGTGDGQFYNGPNFIAVTPTGNVYVTDSIDDRVERFFNPADWVSGTNNFTDPSVGPTSLTVSTLAGATFNSGFTLSSAIGLTAATLTVGYGGTFTQSGGTLTAAALNIIVGTNGVTSSPGTFNYAGGAYNVTTTTVSLKLPLYRAQFIGAAPLTLTAAQTFNQAGGSVTLPQLTLGGTYNYTNGTFSVPSTFIQPGGIFNAASMPFTGSSSVFIEPGGIFNSTASGATLSSGANVTFSGGGSASFAGITVNSGATLAVATLNLTSSQTITNNGEIQLTDPLYSNLTIASGSQLQNNGLLDGSGRINGAATNSGTIDLTGGTLEFMQSLTNNSGATIQGYGTLRADNGLTNGGTLALAGLANVFGSLTNSSGGTIHLSGQVSNVFFGSVVNSGTINIDKGASGIFYGGFSGAGPINNSGTLEFAAASTSGPVSGNGSLLVGSQLSPAVVQIAPNSGASTVDSLTIAAGSALDLSNNHLLINYAGSADPIAFVKYYLASGYNGGNWNGPGINSSAAAANSTSYGLGYADSADPGNPASLSSDTIEIKYTLLGDANLSGVVDGVDFGIVAANFNRGVSAWDQGDFNYDNVVDGTDFADLAANFNKGTSGAAVGGPAWTDPALVLFAEQNGLMADVPEPIAAGVMALVGAGALWRRRRTNTK